jgi:hypothetical protein
MRTIRQWVCGIRGHDWQTAEDAHGAVTTCATCGKLRHVRLQSAYEPGQTTEATQGLDESRRP